MDENEWSLSVCLCI